MASTSELAVTATFAGVVVAIAHGADEQVGAGTPLVVLEAMKMEHEVLAEEPGVVRSVEVAVGDAVEEVAPAAAPFEALHLLLGALDVAEVRDEHPRPVHPRADDGEPVRAGEPGDVAQVDQVGDQQRVEVALGDGRGEALGPFLTHSRHLEVSAQRLQALAVPLDPLARDAGDAQVADDRDPAPLLARVDVGQVDLDGR